MLGIAIKILTNSSIEALIKASYQALALLLNDVRANLATVKRYRAMLAAKAEKG